MIFRSHRGGTYYTPENTMPAFRSAFEAGFEQIETDPQMTRDGVIVLMHDSSINRTCRNADGSRIDRELKVSDLTYAELLQFDAGIAHSEKFRGTRIPRLEELLQLLDGSDVLLSLDKKIPTDKLGPMLDLVSRYNVKVEFSTADVTRIKRILERLPDAYINYDGVNTDEALAEVASIVRPDRLSVWIYLDKPNFAWLVDRDKVSPEVVARVKKYATVGIANVCAPNDVREAILYNPDIVEV